MQDLIFYLSKMSTLKEMTEETTDRQESKKLAHLKTYSFFVFHQPHLKPPSCLQKVSLKLKENLNGPMSQHKNSQLDKQVQINFYNIQNQHERTQGLLDLKTSGLESKNKLVAYCPEQELLELLSLGYQMGVDMANTPIVLTQPHPTSDLAIFSGWNQEGSDSFFEMTLGRLQNLANKWIKSAHQKVDIWRVRLKMKEDSRLQVLEGDHFKTLQVGKQFEQHFISHFSLGHHVKLAKQYQQKRNNPEKTTSNKMIYKWQKMKKFCCLGSSNMHSSTGIVNIAFRDQKGREIEILKHLREYDGSEQSQLEASKVIKSDNGIYSLILANIDRFHGNKVQELGSKPGDGKIEVGLFEGANKCRRIASVKGQVLLRVDSQCIELQIGESIFRCWGAQELQVGHSSKIKVAISKEVLSC